MKRAANALVTVLLVAYICLCMVLISALARLLAGWIVCLERLPR